MQNSIFMWIIHFERIFFSKNCVSTSINLIFHFYIRRSVKNGVLMKSNVLFWKQDPDIEGVKRRIAELKVKIAQRQKVFDGLIAQFKKEDEQYQRLSKQYLDLQAVYLLVFYFVKSFFFFIFIRN